MNKFCTQHFSFRSLYQKTHKNIIIKKTHTALNQLKLNYEYFGSYLTRTVNYESNIYFNDYITKQTLKHLLLSYNNYRHERKLLKAIIKKFVKQGELMRFAHFYVNITIVNIILIFLNNTKIATREWLRSHNQLETEDEEQG